MTYAFGDLTVTSWGRDRWRVRSNDVVAEFNAPRDTAMWALYLFGSAALRGMIGEMVLEHKEAAPTEVGAASLLTITGQAVVTITGVNGDPVVHVADEPARRTEKGIGRALADFFALTHSQLSAPVNPDLRAGPAAVPDCARGGDEPG